MAAHWYRARSELRHRRTAAAGLALIVALSVAFPAAAVAGARRTATALDRMRAELAPAEADVQFEADAPPPDALERVAALPGVLHAAEGASFMMQIRGAESEFFSSFGAGGLRGGIGTDFERPRLREGRLPTAADEVLVSAKIAAAEGISVGDHIEVETLSPAGLVAIFDGEGFDGYGGPVVGLDVVGIGLQPEEVTGGADAIAPVIVVAPTFFDEWEGAVAWFDGMFLVDLADGFAGVDRFENAVRAEFASRDDVSVNVSSERERIEDAAATHALALWLLAGAAAAAGAVASVQAVRRFVTADDEDRVLSSLGAVERDRTRVRLLLALPPAAAGVLVGGALAVAASFAFPTGAIRRVDPGVGLDVDALALAGAVVSALALVATSAWRPPAPSRIRERTGASHALTRMGDSVALSSGLRRALAPADRIEVGLARSAVAAAAAAIVGVTATVVFASNLGSLVTDPPAYGYNWDLSVGLGDGLDDATAFDLARGVVDDERITAASFARVDNVVLEGRDTGVFAFEPVVGAVELSVVAGRPATGPMEVTLGGTTLDALGVGIGDRVQAEGIDGGEIELTVVGQSLFPTVENEDPANGAGMRLTTFQQLASPGSGFPELYVEIAGDADPTAVAADLEDIGFVSGVVAPPVIDNLRDVDTIPWVLSAFLAVLGLAATGHALSTSMRNARRELASLKVLGLARRQLAGSVVTQACAFAGAALVVGVPLGLAAGRQSWRAVADALGFSTAVNLSPVLLLVPPVAVAVALVLAARPARHAASTPAATVLRAE